MCDAVATPVFETACGGYDESPTTCKRGDMDMAILRNLAKIGLAKKVYDEARKPENQRRVKGAVASLKEKQAARSRRRKT